MGSGTLPHLAQSFAAFLRANRSSSPGRRTSCRACSAHQGSQGSSCLTCHWASSSASWTDTLNKQGGSSRATWTAQRAGDGVDGWLEFHQSPGSTLAGAVIDEVVSRPSHPAAGPCRVSVSLASHSQGPQALVCPHVGGSWHFRMALGPWDVPASLNHLLLHLSSSGPHLHMGLTSLQVQ